MNWDVLDKQGKKAGSVELHAEVFGAETNDAVVHTAVKVIQANKRQGTHATKTRSLVSGGGRKPYRQKGTGNARQGSTRSPLMPGGATLHGPQPRDYRQGFNKKQRNLAMRVALSERAREQGIVVVDSFQAEKYSTKTMNSFFAALGCQDKSVIVVHNEASDFLFKSTRNIFKKRCVHVNSLNIEEVLRHSVLLLSKSSLNDLTARLKGV